MPVHVSNGRVIKCERTRKGPANKNGSVNYLLSFTKRYICKSVCLKAEKEFSKMTNIEKLSSI